MPLFAVNYMPGLGPKVFLYPLLTVFILGAILAIFFSRHPDATPEVERDTDTEGEGSFSKPGRSPFSLAHYDRVVPAVIAALFYLLALWRLDFPHKQVFDEVHHVRTAMEFVVGANPHEWTHPHLSKLLQAGSLALARQSFDPSDNIWSPDQIMAGRAALAWRLPSVIFGSLALLGVYALARALFKNRAVATIAMLLLAMDGVFFVQSRIAMTNIFTVCFITWAAWAAWRWIEEQQARHIFATGAFLGLALATRWSSLYAFALLLLFVLADGIARWHKEKYSARFFLTRAALFIPAFLLVPALIYAASYIPYVLQGDGTAVQKLMTWNHNGTGWEKVLSMQGDMYRYHSELKADHSYDSPAWSWPLMLRPVWYFYEQIGGQGAERVRGIWCIGNAFIWWAIIPSMAIGTWLAVRFRRGNLALLCLMGLGQWFCWLAKARGLNFMHYLFEAIPFVCIAIAYFMVTLWCGNRDTNVGESKNTSGDTPEENREPWRTIVLSYLLAVLLWFVFYYPMLTAFPIPVKYSQMHFWLDRIWI
ncbi:MAG: phospholipid carrier-dependent glycosyltransferase [Akkermansiaceae bacterium]|nr:phospholipid carrier-dependent glycosyltransferase [Armatimonadota bacterium]